jgi:hypothetical protein
MIYTSRPFKFPHYGLVSGRIQVDLTHSVRPLQRHIWTRADGSEDAEPWIATIRETEERLLANGFTRATDGCSPQ